MSVILITNNIINNLEASLRDPPPNAPKYTSLSTAQFTNKLSKPELCNTLEPPIQT